MSKNLCNYPLARDPHTRQQWRRSKPNGHLWLCKLPGDDRIELRLNADADARLKRCPNAFDINVLLLLLGEAQERDKDAITFPSSATILKALGTTVDSRNRRRLKGSLQYWCALSIRYDCWHEIGKENQVRKTLHPPIQSLPHNGRQVKVTLQQEWIDLNKGYFAKLPLPLPTRAAAQNLVLALSTLAYSKNSLSEGQAYPRAVRSLCRKIGLNHSTRTSELLNMLNNPNSPMNAWFKRQKRKLLWSVEGSSSKLKLRIVPIEKDPLESNYYRPPEPYSIYNDPDYVPYDPPLKRRQLRRKQVKPKPQAAPDDEFYEEPMYEFDEDGRLYPRRL